jgi:hypothetical protein
MHEEEDDDDLRTDTSWKPCDDSGAYRQRGYREGGGERLARREQGRASCERG